MFASDTIYSDLNVDQIKSIPSDAVHRNVDLAIVDADEKGYARTYIVLPSTIYGFATHHLVEAGISNPISIQIPNLIRASLSRKQAGMVGLGKAIWPDVHIDDGELVLHLCRPAARAALTPHIVADLYIVIFDALTANPEGVGHGWEGFYFGENGEHTWYDISKEIARTFVELGLRGTDEPTTFTDEELAKYWGSVVRHDLIPPSISRKTVRPTHMMTVGVGQLQRDELALQGGSWSLDWVEAEVHNERHDREYTAPDAVVARAGTGEGLQAVGFAVKHASVYNLTGTNRRSLPPAICPVSPLYHWAEPSPWVR